MRAIALSACAAFVLCAGPLPQAAAQPAVDAPPAGDVRIVWEVKNRFRLFRNEAD